MFVRVSTLTLLYVRHAPICHPVCTRFRMPNGGMLSVPWPMSVTSLCSVFAPRRTSQDRLGRFTGTACAEISKPRLTSLPMLMKGNPPIGLPAAGPFCVYPEEGGSGCCSNRSLLSLLKYVSSTPIRSFMKPASKPASNSEPRSNRRLGLPGLSGTAPGETPLASRYGSDCNVVSDAPAWGMRPVCPYAARNRSVFTAPTCQNGSSLVTHDRPTLGRTTQWV